MRTASLLGGDWPFCESGDTHTEKSYGLGPKTPHQNKLCGACREDLVIDQYRLRLVITDIPVRSTQKTELEELGWTQRPRAFLVVIVCYEAESAFGSTTAH